MNESKAKAFMVNLSKHDITFIPMFVQYATREGEFMILLRCKFTFRNVMNLT